MNELNQNKKVDICHISSVHYYFDSRIFYKECRSLVEAGYRVRFIARKEDGVPQVVEGVEIVPFPDYKNLVRRLMFAPWRMLRMALKQNARAYHFHDPELLPVGVILKLFGKKVIYDAHEDYGKQLVYKPWLKSLFLKKLIAGTYRILEVTAVLIFNKVVVATDDIRTRFPARKTVTIKNVPVLKTLDEAPIKMDIEKTKPVIIYAGALAGIRGVEESIRAMSLIEQDAELWLLGKWESEDFRTKCEQLDGWRKVRYFGLKKPHEVYGYMKRADIGLTLLHPITNYLTSLPVKTFEYLVCGVPMIMSDFDYWHEFFGDNAVFCDPQSAEVVAERISSLLNNPAKRKFLCETGSNLVRNHYVWEKEKEILIQIYKQLLN